MICMHAYSMQHLDIDNWIKVQKFYKWKYMKTREINDL